MGTQQETRAHTTTIARDQLAILRPQGKSVRLMAGDCGPDRPPLSGERSRVEFTPSIMRTGIANGTAKCFRSPFQSISRVVVVVLTAAIGE